MQQNLLDSIKSAKLISFDVFETLIWRSYARPIDLFNHIEAGLDATGFAKARREGEQEARRLAHATGHDEVTLDQIYAKLPGRFATLRDVEIDQEINCCRRDEDMFAVYQFAREQNKKIVLASDMYLPAQVIKKILAATGYDTNLPLFLSSVTKKPKATGAMFKAIVNDTGVAPTDILHIGDNPHSDFKMPRKMGCQAYLYVPSYERHGLWAQGDIASAAPPEAAAAQSIMLAVQAQNRVSGAAQSFWERLGYEVGGPIALAFCAWLEEEARDEGLERLLFLGRDGYAFYNLYAKLYPDASIAYIPSSRRATLFAAARQVDDRLLQSILPDLMAAGLHKPLTMRDVLTYLDIEALSQATANVDWLDKLINNKEMLTKARELLRKHGDVLLSQAAMERAVYLDMLKEASDHKKAIGLVDLGWKGTLLDKIQHMAASDGQDWRLVGLYFATHSGSGRRHDLLSCALRDSEPRTSVLNQHLAVLILEAIFSAPSGSLIRMEDGRPKFMGTDAANEAERVENLDAAHRGLMAFVADYRKACGEIPVTIDAQSAVLPLQHRMEHLTEADRRHLAGTTYTPLLNCERAAEPLVDAKHDKRFGIVIPWAGTLCAEYEVVARIQRAAANIGAECVLISREGFVLTDAQEMTGKIVDPSSLSFAISIHYHMPKVLDAYTYLTLWNPPEIPMGTDDYFRIIGNYQTYDDFLSAESDRIKQHLLSIIDGTRRPEDEYPLLYTSFPADVVKKPNLKDPVLFYCGMNWERVVRGSGARHEGLFKMLDNAGVAAFYGPEVVESWGGIRPWEGYDSYRGSIPFDGFSILEEINRCGVVLVLSSDIHRQSGMATTRVFEAAAGGAVIISDRNAFVEKHFGDAVLFVDYDRERPDIMFEQIMEHLTWIRENYKDAQAMAERAQGIFREHLALEQQLIAIIDQQAAREEAAYAKLDCQDAVAEVIYYLSGSTFDRAVRQNIIATLSDLEKQKGIKARLVILCAQTLYSRACLFLEQLKPAARYEIVSVEPPASGRLTAFDRGRALHVAITHSDADYFVIRGRGEDWHSDHLASLAGTLKASETAVVANCGTIEIRSDNSRHPDVFAPLDVTAAYRCSGISSGELMFDAEFVRRIPSFVFEPLDGSEHYALLFWAEVKEHRRSAFSHRATLAYRGARGSEGERSFEQLAEIRYVQGLFRLPTETVQGESDALASRANGLETELEDTRALLIERTEELVGHRDNVIALDREIERWKEHARKLESEIGELRQHVTLWESAAENYHQLSAALQNDIEERDVDLAETRQTLIDRTQRLEVAVQELERLHESEALHEVEVLS
jgi:HAD superfamily hydrolase (TIGR01549 family)